MGKGPNGLAEVGEFRELVLIETETPPLADAAFAGNPHLFSPPRVQLEEGPLLPHLCPQRKKGLEILDTILQLPPPPQGLFTFQLILPSPKKLSTSHRRDIEVQKCGTAGPRSCIWEGEGEARLSRTDFKH